MGDSALYGLNVEGCNARRSHDILFKNCTYPFYPSRSRLELIFSKLRPSRSSGEFARRSIFGLTSGPYLRLQEFSGELSHSALGSRWHAISATPNSTLLLQIAIACIPSNRMPSVRSNWHSSVRGSSMIGVEATRRLLARPVLLVAPGGEPPDTATVRSDGGAGCGVVGATRVEKQTVAAEKSILSEPGYAAVSGKNTARSRGGVF
jgi:hypothetical protein